MLERILSIFYVNTNKIRTFAFSSFNSIETFVGCSMCVPSLILNKFLVGSISSSAAISSANNSWLHGIKGLIKNQQKRQKKMKTKMYQKKETHQQWTVLACCWYKGPRCYNFCNHCTLSSILYTFFSLSFSLSNECLHKSVHICFDDRKKLIHTYKDAQVS